MKVFAGFGTLFLFAALMAAYWCQSSGGEQPVIGAFTIFNRESPYLIAAPHGEYDEGTGEIVWEFCQKVRWDCLIAEGFRAEHAPINVNRPTEGVSLAETRFTERASLVYARYVRRITRIAPTLRFYVEIHGNDYPGSRDRIEVATVGLTKQQAIRIERLGSQLLADEGLHYELVIDLLDPIRFRASQSRKFGVLSFIRPALHIELPVRARKADRERTVKFLTGFLAQAALSEFPNAKR